MRARAGAPSTSGESVSISAMSTRELLPKTKRPAKLNRGGALLGLVTALLLAGAGHCSAWVGGRRV